MKIFNYWGLKIKPSKQQTMKNRRRINILNANKYDFADLQNQSGKNKIKLLKTRGKIVLRFDALRKNQLWKFRWAGITPRLWRWICFSAHQITMMCFFPYTYIHSNIVWKCSSQAFLAKKYTSVWQINSLMFAEQPNASVCETHSVVLPQV